MLIGDLARMLGVTPKTLRHYEKIGLIPEPGRSENSYRTYSDAAVERARLVVALRQLDLSTEVVRQLLDETGDGRSLRGRLMGQLDEQVQDYQLRISVMQGKLDDLQARYDALLSTGARHPGNCICGALLQPCTCVKP